MQPNLLLLTIPDKSTTFEKLDNTLRVIFIISELWVLCWRMSENPLSFERVDANMGDKTHNSEIEEFPL